MFVQLVWNIPTQTCAKQFGIDVDVEKYGILENKMDGRLGDVIGLFYSVRVGFHVVFRKRSTAHLSLCVFRIWGCSHK